MLFHAPAFLFLFLPATLLAAWVLPRRLAIWALVIASLVFYGWDKPGRLLPILLGSVLFNYAMGWAIARRPGRGLLALGVAVDLGALFWFKYANFAADSLGAVGLHVPIPHVSLPIGISFFTFTQIAFLVDTARGHAHRYKAVDYTLFVTFFPHLVAGPILRHDSIVPQFARLARPDLPEVALAASWFVAGLFKKVVLADGVAPIADRVFGAASSGATLGAADAWIGAAAYALQLYFDFSGYSDMAIGLARLFGISFPVNFDSPYKSASLIEFWRRWHITLSRFLRDYLYVPLGGRDARSRNLMITMLLGGLWHGAGWTFLVWGGLHGAGLVVNHAWGPRRLPLKLGHVVTLLFVVAAWVPFRAPDFATTGRVWAGMVHPGGSFAGWEMVLGLLLVALFAPNTQQIFAPGPPRFWRWRLGAGTAAVFGVCLAVALAGSWNQPTSFLYFRF